MVPRVCPFSINTSLVTLLDKPRLLNSKSTLNMSSRSLLIPELVMVSVFWVNLAVKNYKDKNLMSANFENVLKYQVLTKWKIYIQMTHVLKFPDFIRTLKVHIRHFRKIKYYLDTSQDFRVLNTYLYVLAFYPENRNLKSGALNFWTFDRSI